MLFGMLLFGRRAALSLFSVFVFGALAWPHEVADEGVFPVFFHVHRACLSLFLWCVDSVNVRQHVSADEGVFPAFCAPRLSYVGVTRLSCAHLCAENCVVLLSSALGERC